MFVVAATNDGFVQRCLQMLVGLASASAVYAIGIEWGLPSLVLDYSDSHTEYRISSFYGHPIFFAAFLILPLTLSVYLMFKAPSRRVKYTYGVCCVLQLVGILLTRTRGAIVAVFVGATLAAIVSALKPRARSKRCAMIFIMLLLTAGVLLATFGRRLPGSFQRIASLNSEGRLDMWRIAWQGFKERPLLGFGPENYYFVFNKDYDPRLYSDTLYWEDKPHNQLLEVLVTAGGAGLLAYASMSCLIGYAFYKAYREKRVEWNSMSVLVSGMVAYHVQNLFAFDTPAASVAFYACAGFAGSVWRAKEQDTRVPRRRENNSLRAGWMFVAATLASLCVLLIIDRDMAVSLHSLKKAQTAGLENFRVERAYLESAARSRFFYDQPEPRMAILAVCCGSARNARVRSWFRHEYFGWRYCRIGTHYPS